MSAKQQEIFSNTLIFKNFDTGWTRHKISFISFNLLRIRCQEMLIRCQKMLIHLDPLIIPV